MIEMRTEIETQLDDASAQSKRYVHPKLLKMFDLAGMNATFTRAQGQYLWDAKGNRFLDFLTGGGVYLIGRNHPTVRQAIKDAVDLDLPNWTIVNPSLLGGLLAGKLIEKAGSHYGKVIFTNTGTECTEVMVRFARYVTRRRRFLYLEGAFHGRTYAAISMCGSKALREGQDPLMPTCTPIRVNDIRQLRRELAHGDVAAVVYEPVQGMTCEVLDKGYLREAEILCDQYGTLLCADEVQTGLCRTGPWFRSTADGIRPHMMSCSKILSGGAMPVGAVLVSEDVYQKVFSKFQSGPFYFSTFAEGNLAMAAALATIDVLEEMDAPARVAELSARIEAGVAELAKRYDCIKELRGKGLMRCIYFKDSADLKLKFQQNLLAAADPAAFGAAVHVDLYREHRILLQVPGPGANAIKFLPPACASVEDVDFFLSALDDVLARYYSEAGPAVNLGRTALKATLGQAAEMIPDQYVPPFLKKALGK
ncbi:MAG: aspartate aminotransferase family protein [Oligoflexia bacterium]|nr:aspartate aminotransferase family protein [Oligoflexia bacterium]